LPETFAPGGSSTFTPGGSSSSPAINAGDRTVDHAEFQALTDKVRLPRHGVLDLADLDVVDTLAAVFAAARSGVPVLLRAPDSATPPTAAFQRLPPETFLVAMTSGTSGRPRAVLRSSKSWLASFRPFTTLTGLTSSDTVLLTGSLHATLHLFAAVHILWLGGRLTDRRGAATAVHAVPTMLGDLLAEPPSGLRTAVVAGASLPPAISARAAGLGIKLIEYYGAAELSFVGARLAPAPLRAFPGVEMRIADGALWARSPYLALGRLSLSPPFTFDRLENNDGFATVGDLATITDGALTVRGRGDAAVTTGGSTVVVEEVETVLAEIPGVCAVAVLGVSHERLGQIVTAVVELQIGVDLASVRRSARTLLRGAALPRRWRQIEAMPRTGGGKIARGQLAAWLSQPAPSSGAPTAQTSVA